SISFCAALTPELRSEPSPPGASTTSREMPAARRLTAPRTRTIAMMMKATVAAGMKTSAITASLALMPSSASMSSSVSSIGAYSDLEVHQFVHREIADQHPGDGDAEDDLGDVVLPDAAVEVGRHHLDDAEHQDRQRRQDQRRGAAFGGERAHLA